ncbi:LptA/OstA family protein [Elongatibacter sediminis]|uniref:LptA/OstA family protein n=1 Tax=Elongatibacter sediminis TaxID=3119006 RepID=A0AAW9RE88_9GAMM
MRNYAPRHNRTTCFTDRGLPARTGVFALVLALASPLSPAQEFSSIGSGDMVLLRADSAWEDTVPETIHFRGQFEMQVGEWLLQADRATVTGTLEAPRTVVMKGNPARLRQTGADVPEATAVSAAADHIVYDFEQNRVALDGQARVTQGDSVLHSTHIEYDPATDRLHAIGGTGVRIDIRDPDD